MNLKVFKCWTCSLFYSKLPEPFTTNTKSLDNTTKDNNFSRLYASVLGKRDILIFIKCCDWNASRLRRSSCVTVWLGVVGGEGHQLITHSSSSSRQQCKRKLSNFIVVSLIAPSGTIQSSHQNNNRTAVKILVNPVLFYIHSSCN